MTNFAVFCIIVMFILGYKVGRLISKEYGCQEGVSNEKEVYCHGFEDGTYHTLDEYNPELYSQESAELCYKEYRAIKHGPQKH